MLAMFIDVENEKAKVVTIKPELETYYDMINCRCIDIADRNIYGKTYCIVCDDEGLLKREPKISAVTGDGEPMLVGNLLILNRGTEGNLASLTYDDVARITSAIKIIPTGKFPKGYPMLVGCEYPLVFSYDTEYDEEVNYTD